MVKKIEDGCYIPPFLLKCYQMVDDHSTDELISWGSSNDSFVIWNATEFAAKLLPKYFKHSNFSSFIRQLNIYGFRKIDTDSWIFACDQFVKGQKHLLKNINRRKQKNPVQQKPLEEKEEVEACEVTKELGLWKEVESLKTGKNELMQELVTLSQHQQTSQSKLLVVRQQLHGMEKSQQQMLSFIVTAMQNPGVFVKLLQPKEHKWCMSKSGKNVVKRVIDDPETERSEGMIVRYQAPIDETPEPLLTPAPKSEISQEFGLSTNDVSDLLMDIDMDFLSVFADEDLHSLEKCGPLVLPDLPQDDGIMEDLLSTPFLNTTKNSELDTEEPSDSGRETESTSSFSQVEEFDNFEFVSDEYDRSQNLMMETSEFGNQMDNFQYMETITEQLGLLASESSPKH